MLIVVVMMAILLGRFYLGVIDEQPAANRQTPLGHTVVPRATADSTELLSSSHNSVGLIELSLPASLAGTDIPGGLGVDSDGMLIISEDLIAYFDYFLAALGNEPLALTRLRVENHSGRQLNPAASTIAMKIFDQYLASMLELQLLQQQEQVFADIKSSLDLEYAVRKKHLGKRAEVLFGQDYQSALFALAANHNHQTKKQLSDDGIYQAELSAALKGIDEPSLIAVLAEVEATIGAIEQNAMQEKFIYQTRSKALGEAAASRLAVLDQNRAQWQKRVADYHLDKNKYEQEYATLWSGFLGQNLLDLHFSQSEQLRIKASTNSY